MSETPAPPRQRNILEIIFVSGDERRLRAGWRLTLHTILVLLFLLASAILTFVPIGLLATAQVQVDPGVISLASEVASLLAITGATFLARKVFDRRSIVSLGLKPGWQALFDVLAGIAITFFMMGLIFVVELMLGWTRFDGFSWQTDSPAVFAGGLAIWLGVFLITGWQEELLSRGYHLQNLADGLNLFWGVLISSSIFGLLHLANPGASWLSTLGIVLAGLFLALPYLLTRQLWLSIGLHIGWNVFEGVVFGFPVSGLDTYRLLHHTVSGPELWTGGVFGPEAGLLLIPALLLGALLVYGYTRSGMRAALAPAAPAEPEPSEPATPAAPENVS